MNNTSKDLLNLELKGRPSSGIESRLLVCKKPSLSGRKEQPIYNEKPIIDPVPKSGVLGKARDFLGIISEANKKLQRDTKGCCPEHYNIEVLRENETEYIEMDLMLGIADLHTPDAVAAAEFALSGPHLLPVTGCCSETENEGSGEEEEEECDDDGGCGVNRYEDGRSSSKRLKHCGNVLSGAADNQYRKKRSKIVELP